MILNGECHISVLLQHSRSSISLPSGTTANDLADHWQFMHESKTSNQRQRIKSVSSLKHVCPAFWKWSSHLIISCDIDVLWYESFAKEVGLRVAINDAVDLVMDFHHSTHGSEKQGGLGRS